MLPMNCPACGSTFTLVTYTDPTAGASVTRHRLCLACRLRFQTVESYLGIIEARRVPQIVQGHPLAQEEDW